MDLRPLLLQASRPGGRSLLSVDGQNLDVLLRCNPPFREYKVLFVLSADQLFTFQSYLIGLWFSLRTHASQIWQNPQQLLHPMELPTHTRMSLYHKPANPSQNAGTTTGQPHASLHRKASNPTNVGSNGPSRTQTPAPREGSQSTPIASTTQPGRPGGPVSPNLPRRVSYAVSQQPGFLPVMESVDHAVKSTDLENVRLPGSMTTDDFTRAVAVATVSALRHQQRHAHSPGRIRTSAGVESEAAGHGGHDAPSWSRTTSASVLLVCTFLYAIIAGTYD